ncbi:PI-actitoxin-Afv2b-like [Haematobia irritans]|uniref:PI-actitoxin-Afv2b-like n=1 Tax=Haematobia irritans TaxID=7368 RepID=UPI003F503338
MKVVAYLIAIYAVTLVSVANAHSSLCFLPHSQIGHCRARIPAWSFNAQTQKCVPFTFGGCGGNINRFNSKAACERQCIFESMEKL